MKNKKKKKDHFEDLVDWYLGKNSNSSSKKIKKRHVNTRVRTT